MKKFFLRIRTFFCMYIILGISFIIGAFVLVDKIKNEYVSYPLVILLAIIVITINISSLVLSNNSKLFDILLTMAKYSNFLGSIFANLYSRYGLIKFSDGKQCRRCGTKYKNMNIYECKVCGYPLDK